MNLAQLFVRVSADISGLKRGMTDANSSMRSIEGTADRLSATFNRMGAAIVAAFSFRAVMAGVDRANAAVDALEASNRKLAATAKITGQNLGFLQVTAQRANEEFRLGRQLSNEFTIELTKLAGKAGQIEKVNEGIAAFLNLGAGRGLKAAETLRAVEQAILGIDEGTDKLFGKNPSVLYEEFANSAGLVASKLTDGEKALAIFSAGLRDGGKLADEYADYLRSAAGQQEQLQIRTEEAAAAIGQAMAGLRTATYPVLTGLADIVIELTGKVRSLAIDFEELWYKATHGNSIANAISRGGRQIEMSAEQFREYVDKIEEFNQKRLDLYADLNAAANFDPNQSPVQTFLDNTTTGLNEVRSAADEAAAALARLDRIVGYRPREMSLGDPRIVDGVNRRRVAGVDLTPVTARGSQVEGTTPLPEPGALAKLLTQGNAGTLASAAAAASIMGGPFGKLASSVSQVAGAFATGGPLLGGITAAGVAFNGIKSLFGSGQSALERFRSALESSTRALDARFALLDIDSIDRQFELIVEQAKGLFSSTTFGDWATGRAEAFKILEGATLENIQERIDALLASGFDLETTSERGRAFVDFLLKLEGLGDQAEKVGDSMAKVNSAMTNVPTVFANALRRFQASTVGLGGTTTGSTRPPLPQVPDAVNRDRPTLEISGPVTVVANDPAEFARQMEAYGQRVAMRAGYSTFALAGG